MYIYAAYNTLVDNLHSPDAGMAESSFTLRSHELTLAHAHASHGVAAI